MISIHAPHTGRDCPGFRGFCGAGYFNPRAPYGARLVPCYGDTPAAAVFQSTRPIRGATRSHAVAHGVPPGFQSTRPIRGATGYPPGRRCRLGNFNPRAPYGARRAPAAGWAGTATISIHAPHTGRDDDAAEAALEGQLFQSTRPIRGATTDTGQTPPAVGHFNPRAPYGARHVDFLQVVRVVAISIHAPHTGRDVERKR